MRSICSACAKLRFRCAPSSARLVHATPVAHESTRIRDLLKSFQDPSSPFYIPPGGTGPAHENDHSTSRPIAARNRLDTAPRIQWSDPTPDSSSPSSSGLISTHFRASAERLDAGREAAEAYFAENGYDPLGHHTVEVAWGEQDPFQHINNVCYVRYLESARLRWVETLANDLPNARVMDMITGKGMGFILKSIAVRYRHPVTYPDNLLVAVKPHNINPGRASFDMAHALWSLKDNKLAATADSTVVMYDYDTKRKGVLDEEFTAILEKRSGEKRIG